MLKMAVLLTFFVETMKHFFSGLQSSKEHFIEVEIFWINVKVFKCKFQEKSRDKMLRLNSLNFENKLIMFREKTR